MAHIKINRKFIHLTEFDTDVFQLSHTYSTHAQVMKKLYIRCVCV